MRKVFSLAAACCLFVSICFATSSNVYVPHPVSDSSTIKTKSQTVTVGIVHTGGTLYTIDSLIVGGVVVPPNFYGQYYITVNSGPVVIKISYANMPADRCFLTTVATPTTTQNATYHASATFTVNMTESFYYLQFLDNVNCN